MLDWLAQWSLFGMFLSGFLAATLLPLSSEIVFASLLVSGETPWVLIATASFGNVLGAVFNYMAGYYGRDILARKWLGMDQAAVEHALKKFKRYGVDVLFFAWVPIIGDPLTFIAGTLKVNWKWFLLIVSIGKTARYIVLSFLLA